MGRKLVHIAFALLAAVALEAAVGCGGTKTANEAKQAPAVEQPVAPKVDQEKKKEFEVQLAKERAEFEKEYNAVKAESDRVQAKFDSLPSIRKEQKTK